MKIAKYILGSILIISAFGGFLKAEVFAGFFFFILGLILLPPISMKIQESFKTFRNKTMRYSIYVVLFILAGSFMDTNKIGSKQNNNNVAEQENRIDLNSKKTETQNSSKKTEPRKEIVLWKSDLDKSEILGIWLQEKYYYEDNKSDATILKDGNSEQKQLTLTKSKYLTSYPFGTGDNTPFDYTLTKNYLSVVTGKLKTEIYGYRVHLSEDKKMLLLKEKSGLMQVFKREKK